MSQTATDSTIPKKSVFKTVAATLFGAGVGASGAVIFTRPSKEHVQMIQNEIMPKVKEIHEKFETYRNAAHNFSKHSVQESFTRIANEIQQTASGLKNTMDSLDAPRPDLGFLEEMVKSSVSTLSEGFQNRVNNPSEFNGKLKEAARDLRYGVSDFLNKIAGTEVLSSDGKLVPDIEGLITKSTNPIEHTKMGRTGIILTATALTALAGYAIHKSVEKRKISKAEQLQAERVALAEAEHIR